MSQRSALGLFREKLRSHGVNRHSPNRYMIPVAYSKCMLATIPRLIEERQLPDNIPAGDPEKSPVFILGHWRSGTTFLQFLLNQDPCLFTQNKFQSLFSDGFFSTERQFKPVLSWLLKVIKPVNEWRKHTAKTMDIDTPSEAEMALISRLFPYTYHWAHFFPRSWRYYFSKYLFLNDITEKEYQKWLTVYGQFLNKLYWHFKEGDLLVKNPGDTGRIASILQLFPNARFIFLHRNPYEVYYSSHKLWTNVQQSISFERLSAEEQQQLVLEVYKWLHQAYFEQKPLLRNDQLVEIGYSDLVANPENTLRHVYSQLALPGFDRALPEFRQYISQNLDAKSHQYHYDPSDIELVDKHWAFAFRQWGYQHLKRA